MQFWNVVSASFKTNEGTPIMRMLIVAFAILGVVPALAQNPLTTTQSPPAGNSSQSTPEPTNSLPKAAGTEKPTQQPGSTAGNTVLTPPPSSSVGSSAAPPTTTPR